MLSFFKPHTISDAFKSFALDEQKKIRQLLERLSREEHNAIMDFLKELKEQEKLQLKALLVNITPQSIAQFRTEFKEFAVNKITHQKKIQEFDRQSKFHEELMIEIEEESKESEAEKAKLEDLRIQLYELEGAEQLDFKKIEKVRLEREVVLHSCQLRSEIRYLTKMDDNPNKNPIYNFFVSIFSWYRKSQIELKQKKIQFLEEVTISIETKKPVELDKVDAAVLDGKSFRLFSASTEFYKESDKLDVALKLSGLSV